MPKILGVAALYALFEYLVHPYLRNNTASSVFEPSSGLALAALLLGGKRYAWSILLGDTLDNITLDRTLLMAAPIALGNTFAALIGAWLLTRNGRLEPTLISLRDFLRLVFMGGCVAGMISALAENSVLLASGVISSGAYLHNLPHLWMGYVLGVILITPLILAWSAAGYTHKAPTLRSVEPAVLLGMSFFAGQIIFIGWFYDSVGQYARAYLMFLFIAWLAVRLGVRGVTVALFMVGTQALLGAYYEVGYFQHDIAQTQLANFWLFMVTLSVVGMALAAYFAEHQQAEEALRTSVASLQAILNNSPYMVWLKDAQGRYVQVNKVYTDYLRSKNDRQIIGKTDFDIWPKELAEKYRGDDAEVLATRLQKHVEELSFDGKQKHWVETFKTPVIDAEGNALGTTGFTRDITERKNNEEKIDHLSRAYRLLSRVNEAIVRAQDRDELFAAICNAAVESRLFKFVWIGVLDENRSSVTPEAYAGAEEGYTDRLNIRLDDEHTGNGPTGRAIRTDSPLICQDIENDPSLLPWRDEALRRGYRASGAFPIHEAGSAIGAITVYAVDVNFFTRDITELMQELATNMSFALDVFIAKARRKLAEDEILLLNTELERRVQERTHQLGAVNQELEAFSYSVSHDLRAPLRSIDGFSQILLKKYHAQLDATGKDYLGRVIRASQRMGHLIDDLLKLSQVTRGALKREQVDLSKIAESVADELRKNNPARTVQYNLQQGLLVYADPGLLRVVMDNLLGNAWKYSGKKALAEIEFGTRDLDGETTYFVRDNGDGFNMNYAHKLFGAFQRLHGMHEFEGTGIGLVTVQRIINRHHGRVWAEAKEGEGATFYFTLPQRERES